MATAVQKITLSSSHDSVSIVRRGLIQSLHVRPVHDTEGQETGNFEVPAGGRRYCELELLVKQKRLTKAAPVPCDANSDVAIDEVSLVENMDRAPLYPLDQFRAFQAMRDKGIPHEVIAATLFVTSQVVKPRLRLVSVSPALLTVSDDYARQEQVWEAISHSWSKEPHQIRRMVTETTVRASDKRAVFVGAFAHGFEDACLGDAAEIVADGPEGLVRPDAGEAP